MIVKRNNKPVDKIFGSSILDMFSSIHTYKMPEFHARSYLIGEKHNFTGPKTRLEEKMLDIDKRIVKPEYTPKNKIDEYSMHHDLDFGEIQRSYNRTKKTPQDKKHHMKLVHEADELFIRGMQTKEARAADPIVSRIAEYAIKGKRALENAGILPTEYISGIGVKQPKEPRKDPAKRLRMLLHKTHNKEDHDSEKSHKNNNTCPLIHHKHSNTKYIIKKLLENKVITI